MEMTHSPVISVIVPVYKVEPYLRCCIDSILAQSFANFELILVDDGSPDGSPTICDEYAQKDNRIRVIHKENGGVSSARNAGLNECIGKFVVFCDSDDYVGADYLSDLVSDITAERENDTLILTNMSSFKQDSTVTTNPRMDLLIDLNSSTAENYMYLVDRYAIYGPYCKLFNRQIIEENQIRFNEALKSAEDFDFNIRYIEHIRYIQTNSKSQYFYRVGYKQGVAHFIDDSAIISCHIMGEGLIKLAKRMGIYEKCFDAISYRMAEKHWLSRLPMIFVQD